MQNVIEDNSQDGKSFWIIGWKLALCNSEPDFYMIFLPGEQDTPLVRKGQIVLFSKEGLKKFVDGQAAEYDDFQNLIDLVCDIGLALEKITRRKVDREATILNVLNFLLDAAQVLPVKIPQKSKRIVYKFADYLTFNTNIDSFFKNDQSRHDVLAAVYTLLGLVIANSSVSQEV